MHSLLKLEIIKIHTKNIIRILRLPWLNNGPLFVWHLFIVLKISSFIFLNVVKNILNYIFDIGHGKFSAIWKIFKSPGISKFIFCGKPNHKKNFSLLNISKISPNYCFFPVDVTVYHNGFHGDLNETFLVGNVKPEVKKLVDSRIASRLAYVGTSSSIVLEHSNSLLS